MCGRPICSLLHIPVGTADFPMAADYFAKKQKKAMQINKKVFKFLIIYDRLHPFRSL